MKKVINTNGIMIVNKTNLELNLRHEVYGDRDCVEFNCPICEEEIIILFFYPYYITDCDGKMINPYIPSICGNCRSRLNYYMENSELNPKRLEDMLKKLGVA